MNEASEYRSEIIDAALLPDDNAMQAWGNNVLPAQLVIQRVPYREGPQSELPLWSIANTTSGTGGRGMAGILWAFMRPIKTAVRRARKEFAEDAKDKKIQLNGLKLPVQQAQATTLTIATQSVHSLRSLRILCVLCVPLLVCALSS